MNADAPVLRELKDRLDLPATLAHLVTPARLVPKDLWAFMDLLDLAVHAVRRANQALRVLPVLLVP